MLNKTQNQERISQWSVLSMVRFLIQVINNIFVLFEAMVVFLRA